VELYHNDKKIEWNEQNVYDQYHADVALSASDILYIWISDMEDCQGDDGAWRLLNSVFCIEATEDGATTTTTTTKTTTTTTTATSTVTVITRLPIIGGSCGNCWHVQDGKVDAIDFVSSKDIEIRGISLFRSYTGTKTFTGLIQLKEGSSVIASQMFDFTTDDAQTYFDQLFNTPSNVRAGVKYTITLEYNGPRTRIWYGTDGQTSPSTTCGGDSVAFQFSGSAETNNGNNVRHGQIPRVLISC